MSLFGRLGGAEEPLRSSIARNLEAVLNAKRGYSAAVEVFGLGRADGYFAARPLVEGIVKDMLETIRAYEPRISSPTIELVGRDREQWVNFELRGNVGGEPCAYCLQFHSILRHVRVGFLRQVNG